MPERQGVFAQGELNLLTRADLSNPINHLFQREPFPINDIITAIRRFFLY